MKQKHTKAKKANRHSSFSKTPNYKFSKMRVFKREDLQPEIKRCYGLQVRRIQHVVKERYNGVRHTIIINIEQASK